MLKNFYPELRNACYVAVYYDVLNDVAADAINAANTQIRAGKYAEALNSCANTVTIPVPGTRSVFAT